MEQDSVLTLNSCIHLFKIYYFKIMCYMTTQKDVSAQYIANIKNINNS